MMAIQDISLTSCYERGLLELHDIENSSLDTPDLALFDRKTMKITLPD